MKIRFDRFSEVKRRLKETLDEVTNQQLVIQSVFGSIIGHCLLETQENITLPTAYVISLVDLVRVDRVSRYVGISTLFKHLRMTQSELHAFETLVSIGEPIRLSQATEKGVRKDVVYSLFRKGVLQKLCPGVFWPYSSRDPGNMDHFRLFTQCPKAVICLVSALAIHELTDEIPRNIHVSIPARSRAQKVIWPPVKFHQYSVESFRTGIEEMEYGDVSIRVYGKEKSIADSFKFSEQIGRNTAMDALKRYLSSGDVDIDLLMEHARVCRVDKLIYPYLEALLGQ